MLPLKQVAQQFKEWTLAECKAYRAGALAGLRSKPLAEGFTYEDGDEDDLTLCYLRGYADAIGHEAESYEWFDEVAGWRIEERWWDVLY